MSALCDQELEQLLEAAHAPRELVTLADAARRLSVPYQTLAAWKRRGLLDKLGISATGSAMYNLADLRRLAENTPRRKRRRK